MNIGVTTFLNTKSNYGQVLQAYALQYVLKEMGHNPYVLREDIDGFPFSLRLKGWLQKIFNPRLLLLFFKPKYIKKNEPDRYFCSFVNKHINVWPHVYKDINDMNQNAPSLDVMITGSDQVWNKYMTKEKHFFYLLQFGSVECRRLSYAASFGRDSLCLNEKKYFKNALLKFSLVSVRESTGKSICDNLGVKSTIVADPVALLPKDKWIEVASELGVKDISKMEEDAFVYMIANSNGESNIIANIISQIKGKCTSVRYASASRFSDPLSNIWPTIPEWINIINTSKIVITDSFHCTLFSIILNTPFVVIPREGSAGIMNNRITTLLNICGLDNRFIKNYEENFFDDLVQTSIDWTSVNEKMAAYRKESIGILQSALL